MNLDKCDHCDIEEHLGVLASNEINSLITGLFLNVTDAFIASVDTKVFYVLLDRM